MFSSCRHGGTLSALIGKLKLTGLPKRGEPDTSPRRTVNCAADGIWRFYGIGRICFRIPVEEIPDGEDWSAYEVLRAGIDNGTMVACLAGLIEALPDGTTRLRLILTPNKRLRNKQKRDRRRAAAEARESILRRCQGLR